MKKKIITIVLIALAILYIIGLFILIGCSNQTTKELSKLNSYETKLNAETITYDDKDLSGYTCATQFTFTKNIAKDKAAKALKDYMVFYYGKPVHTESIITISFTDTGAKVNCTFPNGDISISYTGFKVIDSPDGVEFAGVTVYSGFRYACVVEKTTCPSGYDVNKIPVYVNNSFYHNLKNPTYDLKYNDSLQEECETWSEATIQTGNGKYYHTLANVSILNDFCVDGFSGSVNNQDSYQANENTNSQFEQQFPESEAPNITNPDNNSGIKHDLESFGNSIKEGFENFKTNLENNQTFRISTIAISSVTGIGVLYIIFLIIRKLWRVIKN
jgi:hypothetical protein